jgi:23S rRNA (cytosine1962-C5)-methyltransferase
MSLPRITLRKDVGQRVKEGHPWIYREACAPFSVEPGTFVEAVDREGHFVATGYADDGPIAVRVLGTKRGQEPLALLPARIASALRMRAAFIGEDTNAYRILHGEGDGLPGVVVDRYDRYLMMKFDGPAAERALLGPVTATLRDLLPEHTLLIRRGRGETKTTDAVHGTLPSGAIVVLEHGMKLLSDLSEGQKTGLFLDHRESRFKVRALSRGARVLNLYGYVGGFSIAAGLGGATHVETVDVAKGAIELANRAWLENGLAPEAHVGTVADVPTRIDTLRRKSERFDVVIADPPSFAPNQASIPNALSAYRKLHAACLRLLAPGGFYLAASCSSHVDTVSFERTLREANDKTESKLQILDRWSAPPDHPRLLAFPEGDYLKCVLARLPG